MGLLDTLLGSTPDQQAAIQGLLTGYAQTGGLLGGFAGAGQAVRQAREDARLKALQDIQMQQAQMGLQKGGIELDMLRQNVERSNRIRNRLMGDQQPPQQAAPSFSTPEIGGLPFFSQGTKQQPQIPAPQSQAPAQGGLGSNLTQNFLRQAQVYASEGDFDTANKLYEHAAKFMPEVHKIEVAMQGNQPVNVITYKDGTQQVSPFGAKPDVHWADTGGRITAINQLTMQPMGSLQKTMTPDAVASNALGWANNSLEQKKFANTVQTQNQPVFHDGAWVYRPSAQAPQGAAVTPAGMPPKPLTEFQGKSTSFAARMQDAAKVIDSLEKQESGPPSATQVAMANYKAEFPSWVPGGQIVGGIATAANQQLNPAVTKEAQQYRQAQETWVASALRQESGAAIGKEEMDRFIKQYFPQPGEGEAIRKQKAAARKVAERAMLAQAGPGVAQLPSILNPQQGPMNVDSNDPLGIRR